MCGIVGHAVPVGHVPDNLAVSAGMRTIRHRGPDDEGMVRFGMCCLGHRRLSIIDVAGSLQPWQSEDGRYSMVFNGEIYNYVELRNALEKESVAFRSRGDTEVLLAMYVRYGVHCLDRLNGMFAFAIWDEKEATLFLARDRIGKKPLYYAAGPQGLAFASEIEALHGFKYINTAIDMDAVEDFFAHQFIGGERSIYRGVRKLPAAHYLIFEDGRTTLKRYWTPPRPETSARPLAEWCEELTSLFDDAVKLRLRSDVPLGAFLSGGIDSSLIVASVRRMGIDLATFTVGFRETGFDESPDAQEVAVFFKTQHHSRTLELELPNSIERCFGAFGEPFADPSALPMERLCQHTRDFVTVALSGDGVDELFGGYRRYYARRWLERFRCLPQWLFTRLFQGISSYVPETDHYYGHSPAKQLRLFAHMMKAQTESPGDPLAQVLTASERHALLENRGREFTTHDYVRELALDGLNPLSQMMFADLQTYLVDDILVKVDRMSMRHSLEVRAPFLDYRLVEFACRVPAELKIRGSVQKYLIRECFRNRLPPGVQARKKHGFAVPVGQWFRTSLRPLFEDVVLQGARPDFISHTEVQRLWSEHQAGRADHGFRLWCLLGFYFWYSKLRF